MPSGKWEEGKVVSRKGERTHLTLLVRIPLPPKRAERGVLGKEKI